MKSVSGCVVCKHLWPCPPSFPPLHAPEFTPFQIPSPFTLPRCVVILRAFREFLGDEPTSNLTFERPAGAYVIMRLGAPTVPISKSNLFLPPPYLTPLHLTTGVFSNH